jgi:hypothetical protein
MGPILSRNVVEYSSHSIDQVVAQPTTITKIKPAGRVNNKQQELDKRIQAAVEKHGTQEQGIWGLIASEVGGGISASTCKYRWVRLKIEQEKWKPEVLNRMQELTAQFSESSQINWIVIVNALNKEFGSRYSLHDCEQYYKRVFNHEYAWSKNEDAQLTELVIKYKKDWNKISTEMNDRTNARCRYRWEQHLNPDIIHGKWSEEEDVTLLHLFSQYGRQWSKIAKEMNSRTDKQCCGRYQTLQRINTSSDKKRKHTSSEADEQPTKRARIAEKKCL